MTILKQLNNLGKILFIDRDGVINKDENGYTFKYEEVEYNYDLLDFIKEKYPNHIKIIVTNQSGIARGLYTDKDFQILMKLMLDDLKDLGIYIDDVYHAPYLPNSNHPDRKPNPGMINKGLSKYNINPANCTMIGDNITDYYAAKDARLGYFTYYVKGVFSNAKI